MSGRPAAAELKQLGGQIIALLGRKDYRALDKVELSKALRWPSERRRELRELLRDLEDAGRIVRLKKDRYVLPSTADLVTGVLQVHAGGNAHLLGESGKSDVFISAADLGMAMHGDRVVARLKDDRRDRRGATTKEAQVIKVLARANDTVVGTLQVRGDFHHVVPDDSRLPHHVQLKPGSARAQIGDKVVVKLEPWESREANPEGEIIEVLGPAAAPGVDMLSIVRKYQLPTEFPDEVLREAERISTEIDSGEIAAREDLREMPVITIDPDDAKDFDDAINVESIPGGGWRLGVHIADVSHYVRPGTALDREARVRGNSTYLADRVIPMLPERLSNGICSLKPGVDRLTFSAFIDFNAQGKIKSARFARSVIRSLARLSYRQALAILSGKSEMPPLPPNLTRESRGQATLAAGPPVKVDPYVAERVQAAWELASLLRRNRFAAGSLDLDFPEVKVWLDEDGRAVRLERLENDISHQLIEECMLAANEVVARETKHRSVPAVYRIHEDPEPDRLMDFREFAATHGFKAGDLTQRREVQKLLSAIKGAPEEYAIKLGFLKSLKRAAYAVNPLGHYGLAKVNYTHFTSPIRRYADLVVHRVLARQRAGTIQELAETAEHISGTERTSADAEKDSVMLKKMEFFQRQLTAKKPEAFRAVVVDIRNYGLVVELPDVMVTGLVHVSSLTDDFYQFDNVRMAFSGRRNGRRFALGNELQVIVSRVDAYKRQIDFVPAGEPAGAERGSGRRTPQKPQRERRTKPSQRERRPGRGRSR